MKISWLLWIALGALAFWFLAGRPGLPRRRRSAIDETSLQPMTTQLETRAAGGDTQAFPPTRAELPPDVDDELLDEAALRAAYEAAEKEQEERTAAARRADAVAAAEQQRAADEARREAEREAAEAVRAARAEAARIEAQRVEAARIEAERAEAARIEAERAEAARVDAERAEAARLEAERAQAARAEAERIEAGRLRAGRAEAARVEAERVEAERREAARLEAERLEAARIEAERAEAERIAAEAAQAALRAAAAPRRTPDQTLVMVADDSKVVRVKTSRLLAKHQFRVVLAEDGADALRQIESEIPDVLITDVEMPGVDGFELTRRVRSNPRTAHVPIIMITSADDRLRAAAAEAGVTALLGKPYPDEALVAHIGEHAHVAVA